MTETHQDKKIREQIAIMKEEFEKRSSEYIERSLKDLHGSALTGLYLVLYGYLVNAHAEIIKNTFEIIKIKG